MGAAGGLASVIVGCSGPLGPARRCVAALLRCTRGPWELVAVGADADAEAYLRGVQDAAPVRVEVLAGPAAGGLAAAYARGAGAARGDYLALLGDDVVVTDGWLDALVALAECDPAVALAGPMANLATPPQLVREVPYADPEGLRHFAADWRAGHRGRGTAVTRLDPFCLLAKRAALEALGGPGEQLGPQALDELMIRARRAGHALAVAQDLFVHRHWGPAPEAAATGSAPGPPAERPAPQGPPRISVIMPVRDGMGTLGRALASLRRQTMTDWELVAVDDGSADGSYEHLLACGRADPRVRPLRAGASRGPGAARNLGLGHAAAEFVAYLDCDDEYYPDYLERVDRRRDRGDLLIGGYDIVGDDAAFPRVVGWEPAARRALFYEMNVATPLGVAHRRDLALRAGGFAELAWREEDWDLWKRLARAGARVEYLPGAGGLYHVREGSLSRAPRLAAPQREGIEANWRAGRPLYGGPAGPVRGADPSRVLFANSTPPDPADAGAVAAGDVLALLARSGLACRAFGPAGPAPDGAAALLAAYERCLGDFRPDLLLVHGADPGAGPLIRLARRRDLTVVLLLLGMPACGRDAARDVDHCLGVSGSLRRRCWEELGLACSALPPAIDWDRIAAPRPAPRHVALLDDRVGEAGPAATRIVAELAARRPDIPVRVVDGSGPLAGAGILLAPAPGGGEALVLPVAGAMIGGIPVVVGGGGALPEVVGDAGLILEVPARPDDAPALGHWVAAVIRLWDDPGAHGQAAARGLQHAERWRPGRVAPAYVEFFRAARPQPCPPFIPR